MMPATRPERSAAAPPSHVARAFIVRATIFLAIFALLYGAVYAGAESLVHRYTRRNLFFAISTAPPTRFDYVILGTSHAAVMNYRDLNARLEEMSGRRVINLAILGGGPTVSRLVFDHFRARHHAGGLVYVLDSFALYSRRWNEERIADSRLFARAAFDPALGMLLLRRPYALPQAIDYLAGFSKINNAERFATDVSADEGARFERAYRPVPQLDEERLAYLYPRAIDAASFDRYLGEFSALLDTALASGMRVVVVRPPLPARVLRAIPDEDVFNTRVRGLLAERGLSLHDFSTTGNDEALFFDPDHLNLQGVLNFFSTSLAPLLK